MEGRPLVPDTWVQSGFETGPGRNQAIKGVTSPNPSFSGYSAQLVPLPNMDVSAPLDRQRRRPPLTFFLYRPQMA